MLHVCLSMKLKACFIHHRSHDRGVKQKKKKHTKHSHKAVYFPWSLLGSSGKIFFLSLHVGHPVFVSPVLGRDSIWRCDAIHRKLMLPWKCATSSGGGGLQWMWRERKGLVSEFKCNVEGRKINACMLLLALDAWWVKAD